MLSINTNFLKRFPSRLISSASNSVQFMGRLASTKHQFIKHGNFAIGAKYKAVSYSSPGYISIQNYLIAHVGCCPFLGGGLGVLEAGDS